MRSPFVTALLNPANLAMLALSVAAGLCAAWWLFPLGLLLWSIMFFVILRDPALRMKQAIETRASLAYRFQQRFDRIERSQVALNNGLISASSSLKQSLSPVQEAVNALVEQAYQACLRMTALENRRLVLQRSQNLTEEMALIDAKILSAHDLKVKQQYEESRAALQERINKFQATSAVLDQFEAQLISLDNDLSSIVTETIHLQTLGKKASGEGVTALLAQVRVQQKELAEFDRRMNE
ncbi:MAG: hypothetical protein ACOYYS_14360 [Chloroflexota bacterium]